MSKAIKRNVYTAAGIILSIVIAVGGWFFTSRMIDMESERLLSATTVISIDSPGNDGNYPAAGLGLSEDEIVSILRSWEATDNRRVHEPAAGQLNMEQAITAAREGVSFLYDHSILPDYMLVFNAPPRTLLAQNIAPDLQFLPAEYSYWSVSFENEYIAVAITINAVTGQIWGIEITPRRMVSLLAHYTEFENILTAFTSGLEINFNYIAANTISFPTGGGGEFIVDVPRFSFANGDANAVITAWGRATEDGVLFINMFRIYFTTTAQLLQN